MAGLTEEQLAQYNEVARLHHIRSHMRDTLVLIQARMNSKRFPGKVLAEIDGKTALRHVVEAVLDVADDMDVLTAIHLEDYKALRQPSEDAGVVCAFDGGGIAEDDVLGRFGAIANMHAKRKWMKGSRKGNIENCRKPKWIVRACADSPCLWSAGITHLVNHAKKTNCDYAGWRYADGTNAVTVPNGVFCEVVSFDALKRANEAVPEGSGHREHVTSYIYRNPDEFDCRWLEVPKGLESVRLAVDTPYDLALVQDKLECHGPVASEEPIKEYSHGCD